MEFGLSRWDDENPMENHLWRQDGANFWDDYDEGRFSLGTPIHEHTYTKLNAPNQANADRVEGMQKHKRGSL